MSNNNDIRVYEASFSRERSEEAIPGASQSTQRPLNQPLRIPTPPLPIDWTWIQVNKKQPIIDVSDQESIEMVSIYGGDLIEEKPRKKEGFGGMVGVSMSKPSPVLAGLIDKQIRSTTPPHEIGSFILMERSTSKFSELGSLDDIASPFCSVQRMEAPESLNLPATILDPFKELSEKPIVGLSEKQSSKVTDANVYTESKVANDLIKEPDVIKESTKKEPDNGSNEVSDPTPEEVIRAYLEQYEHLLDSIIDIEYLRAKFKYLELTRSHKILKIVSCLILAGLGGYVLYRTRYFAN